MHTIIHPGLASSTNGKTVPGYHDVPRESVGTHIVAPFPTFPPFHLHLQMTASLETLQKKLQLTQNELNSETEKTAIAATFTIKIHEAAFTSADNSSTDMDMTTNPYFKKGSTNRPISMGFIASSTKADIESSKGHNR